MKQIYLDWAATAPISPQALEMYTKASMEYIGNPSAIHNDGRKASAAIQASRDAMAEILDCKSSQLYFTSGGTESNTTVLRHFVEKNGGASVLIPDFEHPAVQSYKRLFKENGAKVIDYQITEHGFSVDHLLSKIDKMTRLVCLMAVHNETGYIFPLERVIKAIRTLEKSMDHPIHIHSDCVQAGGKIPLSLHQLDLDSASFSAHKIGGPRGLGLLYLKHHISPLLLGGGQENGFRSGTENTAAILSYQTALKEYLPQRPKIKEQANLLEKELQSIEGVKILPEDRLYHPENYLPSILCLSVSPIPAEVMTRVLNDKGFSVSSGSACSNNKGKRERKSLIASGIDKKTAEGAIRVSFGPTSSTEELNQFIETLRQELQELRRAFM